MCKPSPSITPEAGSYQKSSPPVTVSAQKLCPGSHAKSAPPTLSSSISADSWNFPSG